ncbi:lipase family protein [Amycolatopsis umgeniensis]|uniref:Secretory lipase n=1 Tax=Amycolatopsis umgeniensis TaxID=336628 RepID=A0A841B1A7_9PSEU|nr:lipase family protein [Amycolatopsis umgeniensis]MBB5852098.1 hypothetical protein [Amycolatopsis umgeniensis]
MKSRPVLRSMLLLGVLIISPAAGTGVAAAVPSAAPSAQTTIPRPDDDPFYRPPAGYEAQPPGAVLRKREVKISTYLIPTPVRAYQVLVRSTDGADRPIATVSTIMVPLAAPPSGKRTLLSYQSAIDSLGTHCNPSYELRTGLQKDPSAVAAALLKGWVAIQTDYQGPRMSWIAGKVAGRATLDGIRAALALPEAGLGPDAPVAAWGYSGGGHATAWAAQEQPSYAPEMDVKAWVANAFTGDLRKTVEGIDGGPFSGFALAAMVGLSREYATLDPFNDKGKQLAERIGDDCVIELVAANPFQHVNDYTRYDIYHNADVDAVLADNYVGTRAPKGPVLVQQSRFDEIVSPSYNQGSVADWCARGANVEYHLSNVPEHITYAIASVPYAISWISQRLSGVPTAGNCGRTS